MNEPFASRVPPPDHNWAWFFDIDGTLSPIADTPDAVRIAPEILQVIHAIHQQSQGAVALISGRSIQDIDRLFPGRLFAAAGQHGAERRHPNGTVERMVVDGRRLVRMRKALRDIEHRHPGLLLEDKGLSLALHYRQVPVLESLVQREVRSLLVETGSEFLMQTGKCVVEILPAGNTKGTVVTQFMGEAPFHGRLPVFVGDDATDEHAFAVVNALGGCSVKVGPGATRARYRLVDVGDVYTWLRSTPALTHLQHSGTGGAA